MSVKVYVEAVTALLLNATTVAMFVRSCVAQALRRGGGLRHSLHAWALHGKYNKDLIFCATLSLYT